jgi:LytS/YehU family sensor histidine kinase
LLPNTIILAILELQLKMGLIMKENIKDILILLVIFGLLAVAGSFYGFSADDIISTPTQQIKF